MNRIQSATKGIITDEIKKTALLENINPESLSSDIANGLTVIVRNKFREISPLCIGRGIRTKINANIGTSQDKLSFKDELKKLKILEKFGADAVMDLSTGGDIRKMRNTILQKTHLPVGTVPIYEAVAKSAEKYGHIAKMTADDIFQVIEDHAKSGVDFITVHCGVTKSSIERLKKDKRILDVVSRGGAFLLEWIIYNGKENPLYEQYDRLLDIAKKYDLTLSLGDGFRPGCIADATDRSQIEELTILGELRDIALENGIQTIIEGPGHVPINQIELNIKLQKEICKGAPFYVLGPLVTDIAIGYDHISAAIGGAIAGSAGADFLCYVTPGEHIRLPNFDDVRDGVIASKIAAHASDIAKGISVALNKDRQMAIYRKNLDWQGQISLSLNPEMVKKWRKEIPLSTKDVCSMCGDFCAIKTARRALNFKEE